MPLYDPGQQLDGWQIVRFIDSGGNGEVYEVVDVEGRGGALKVLLDYRPESVPYKRFTREIDTVLELAGRPGFIPIWQVHLPEQPRKRDRAWYVMPLAQPLADVLRGRPVADVVAAVGQIAETLAGLHAEDKAHRDIKPGNLLQHESRPVVTDFGLVHLPDAESLTETGRVPGSFGYIADEVMVDPSRAQNPETDVYALAKTLWKLLSETAAYPPPGPLLADGGPHSLARTLTVPHSDALDRILARATAQADARLTMTELAAELIAWLELPTPEGLPEGLDAVLEAARRSLDTAVAARDAAVVRAGTVRGFEQTLEQRSAAVLEAVRSLDPGGAEVGPFAIGSLRALDEQPVETAGSPGEPFHHGVRVRRALGFGREDVLVVDFCLQVPDEGFGTITGLLLAGDEHTNDNAFRLLPTQRAEPGVALEAAIQAAVDDAAAALPEVLESFSERAAHG